MDAALRDAQRRAQESPDDGAARLHYADALFLAGHRAAAWLELRAADELGHLAEHDPRRLSFRVPNPSRPLWILEPVARAIEAVAAPVEDARTPGVVVRSGAVRLPLVVFLGEECRGCDAEGLVCEKCSGTGRCPDSIDNYEYDPWGMTTCRCDGGMITCRECRGTKFQLRSNGAACGHGQDRLEWTGEGSLEHVSLSRCQTCGLATLRSETSSRHACSRCAFLDCRCGPGTLDS